MLKRIHHLGIIVDDLESKMKRFEGFGLHCNQVLESKEGGYKIALFPIGEVLIELISYSPDKEPDQMTKITRAHNDVINHICFEVDNIHTAVQDFQKTGAKLIEGSQRKGLTGQIAFFYPETTEGLLIELNQS
jgi:methylmalonyl-CoA/ethylmalonyl-CoA epimerase